MSMAQLSVVFGLPHIAVVKWTAFQQVCRLVVRFGTRGFMSWMVVWSLCLLGLLGSFTSRGLGLAWVCRAWRADGGALCCGSVWWRGGPDVPQRGLGALARRGGFGVCGARGPTGQGSRLPH